MKRLLFVSVVVVLLVCAFAFTTLAAPIDFLQSNIYGSVVNWQDYVIESREANSSTVSSPDYPLHLFATYADLPFAFNMAIYRDGSLMSSTQGNSIGSNYSWDTYDLYATTDYFVDFQDIEKGNGDSNKRYYKFNYGLTTNRPANYIETTVIFYNRTFDEVARYPIDYVDSISQSTVFDNGSNYWPRIVKENGACYFKLEFHAEVEGVQPGFIVNRCEFGFELPSVFNVYEYPVNEQDGWQYYLDLPDGSVGSDDGLADKEYTEIMGEAFDFIEMFPDYAAGTLGIFSSYVAPLRACTWIFERIISITWVYRLLTVSFVFGVVAYVFNMSIDINKSFTSARKAHQNDVRRNTIKERERGGRE